MLAPTGKNAKFILRNLKDIVGLRIICLYPSEKDKIINEFENRRDEIEIEHFEKKEYTDPFGYRSTHISFALGEERCKLYELDDLRHLRCEIQIRTILEQGWADVSHSTVYKLGVPKLLVEKIDAQIKDDLDDQAGVLLRVDRSFDSIMSRVKNLCK